MPAVYQYNFRAMNCEMGAWVVAEDALRAQERLGAVGNLMATLEAHLSRFRPESELCQLNAQSGKPFHASRWLWRAVQHAYDAAQMTDGLYDPTILDALEAAGYDRSFEKSLDRRDEPLDAGVRTTRTPAQPTFTWRDIRLDARTRTITLPKGMRIDVGGIVKGWAADIAVELLAPLGACLVDASGDIAARGDYPGESGWQVGIENPHQPSATLKRLRIHNRGVATSGIGYRRWLVNGETRHHIIDPRTRRPAQTDLLTATVVAKNAMLADLYAKVGLLLGAEEGCRYLARHTGHEGLLVRADGSQVMTPGFEDYVDAIPEVSPEFAC